MQFRKKPVVVEAQQLRGSEDGKPARLLANWCEGSIGGSFAEPYIIIETLEGNVRATVGDYIIRGVKGEFYPCKPDIFAETYEVAE